MNEPFFCSERCSNNILLKILCVYEYVVWKSIILVTWNIYKWLCCLHTFWLSSNFIYCMRMQKNRKKKFMCNDFDWVHEIFNSWVGRKKLHQEAEWWVLCAALHSYFLHFRYAFWWGVNKIMLKIFLSILKPFRIQAIHKSEKLHIRLNIIKTKYLYPKVINFS